MFKTLLSSVTIFIIMLLLFITITINCDTTSSTDTQTSMTLSDSVQGKWVEPERYDLTFNGDSFYIDIHNRYSHILTYDECYAIYYTNYVIGKYNFKKPDSLILSGVYTDSMHVPKPQSDCSWGPRLSGNVTLNYKYIYSGDTLILNYERSIVLVRKIL